MISLTSAQSYRINEVLDIKVTCINDGFCSNVSFCSINIADPDEDLIVINKNMTNQVSYHNYTITPNKTGEYTISGFCKDGEYSEEIEIKRLVTQTGTELTKAKSSLYITILIISILTFLGILFLAIKLPSKNKSDELTGYIIAVSNLKYVKTFLMGLSYLIVTWISYFIWMITDALIDFGFVSSIFKIIFYALAISTFPLFILYIYFTIANFVRDKDIKDLLLRGISTYDK